MFNLYFGKKILIIKFDLLKGKLTISYKLTNKIKL